MAQLLGLSAEQVDGIRPFFSKEHGVKRVEDRKVLSGIIPVIQKGPRWVDAPAAPTKASTTVAAAGETRVFLIWSFPSCQHPMPQSHPAPQSRLMLQSQRC